MLAAWVIRALHFLASVCATAICSSRFRLFFPSLNWHGNFVHCSLCGPWPSFLIFKLGHELWRHFGLIKQQLCLYFQLAFARRTATLTQSLAAVRDSLLRNCRVNFLLRASRRRHEDFLFLLETTYKNALRHTSVAFLAPAASTCARKSSPLERIEARPALCFPVVLTNCRPEQREAKSIWFWSVRDEFSLCQPLTDVCGALMSNNSLKASRTRCAPNVKHEKCKMFEWKNKAASGVTVLGFFHIYGRPYRQGAVFTISTTVGAERRR